MASKKSTKKAVKKSAKTSTARPVSLGEHHSVSVRKIANGYVTTQSSDKNGKYKSTETFSKTKPQVQITPDKP